MSAMTMDPKRRAEAVATLRQVYASVHLWMIVPVSEREALRYAADELERIGGKSGAKEIRHKPDCPEIFAQFGDKDCKCKAKARACGQGAPGPASSRDVEVLRDIERGCREGWHVVRTDPNTWPAVLSAAISALEAKDSCPLCHQPEARHPGGVYCPTPAKSSSDSMEERIRALEKLLERSMLWLVACPAAEYPDQLVRDINTTLHPHQPWCRGDHSEGARVSDVSEVDRE